MSDRVIAADAHVLVYGLFGIGNTGNDATLDVTLAELKKHLPDVRFTVVASEPERVAADFGVTCVPIRPEPERQRRMPAPARQLTNEWVRWERARALLRTADCLLIPGTGILDDFGVSVMSHAYQLWKWCAAAHSAGTSVKFVSIGAGPVEQAWSRRFFRLAAKVADHRSYRDELSRTFARNVLKLDTTHDLVTPDLVFGLDIEAPPPADNVGTVGVGVMDYHSWRQGSGAPDLYEPYMGKLTQFAADLLEQGKAVKVLVGDSGDLGAAADFRERLLRGAPGRSDVVTVAETPSLRRLCAEIATTDVVVATRYHTIIGALMCGRPAVSISYAGKNKAVMEMFGVGAYCQSIGDYQVDVLQKQFTDATANCADTHRKLRTVARRLRQEVQDHFARIAGEVANRRERAA